MKATIVTKVSIGAQPDLVFEYLTILKYYYLWNPQIRKLSSKKQLQLGSTFNATSMVLGIKIDSHNVVTKYVPSKLFELQNNIGTVHYVANFRLKRIENKTVVVLKTTVSTNSKAFVFTIPLLKQLSRRELQTDMQSLKIAVEHKLK